MDGIKHT